MMAARHTRPPRRFRFTSTAGFLIAGGVLIVVTVLATIGPAGVPGPHAIGSAMGSATTPAAPASTSMPASSSGPPPLAVAVARASAPWTAPLPLDRAGHLRAGSHPSVLPSSLLIVDKLNNRLIVVDPQGRIRWQFPRPGDLAAGQSFLVPDDAFFTPDARYIIVTQEDQSVVTLVNISTHHIVYRFGRPGQPGMGPNQLNNPDDAMALPNGEILTADIQNCRIVLIAPGSHRPLHILGLTTTSCLHSPPRRWGSPNGVFPMPNGHYLVTEINRDWVDEIGLNGTIYWSAHPPSVAYPSDSNQIGADRFLTVDYSRPGQVVIFDHTGRKIWSYHGSGADTLDHPSLALPLPNGDIALNDDYNHRVIIIDPRTNKIMWQYGVTAVAGSQPGYLNNPDGIDLVPPQSLLLTHAATMGTWP
jgi:hypothetical protein